MTIYRFDQVTTLSERAKTLLTNAEKSAASAYDLEGTLEELPTEDEGHRIVGFAQANIELWHRATQSWKNLALQLAGELETLKKGSS